MFKVGDVLTKVVQLKPITDGGLLGAKPPAAGRFFVIAWKKIAILMPLDHSSHVFKVI